MLKLFGVVLCVAVAFAASFPAGDDDDFELPPGTISCQIDSPERDECIREAVQDMLPKLVEGSEHLQIPPIDPFIAEPQTITFKYGNEMSASAHFHDVRFYGAAQAQIQDVKTKITPTHISTSFKTYIPQILGVGYYRGEGRFGDLKIKSKGYFNLTATDINYLVKTEGDIKLINGKEHVQVYVFDVTPDFGDVKIFISGLLPDPDLNRILLRFINQYWTLYREYLPQIKAQIEPTLIKSFNKFAARVPIRKMLYYGEDTP